MSRLTDLHNEGEGYKKNRTLPPEFRHQRIPLISRYKTCRVRPLSIVKGKYSVFPSLGNLLRLFCALCNTLIQKKNLLSSF